MGAQQQIKNKKVTVPLTIGDELEFNSLHEGGQRVTTGQEFLSIFSCLSFFEFLFFSKELNQRHWWIHWWINIYQCNRTLVSIWDLFQHEGFCRLSSFTYDPCCRLLECFFAGSQDTLHELEAVWHQSLHPPSLLTDVGSCVPPQAATGKESSIDVMAGLRHIKDNFKGHWSFSSY